MSEIGRGIWGFIRPLLIAIILAAIIRHFLFAHIMVDGQSMKPTLHDGDHLIINKISYDIGDPERFDIIVFHVNKNTDYIKRVIGMPGDVIKYNNGQLFVNGKRVSEPFLKLAKKRADHQITNDFKVTVPKGTLFVLGDNRDNSRDSRMIGPIGLDRVVGEATFVFWPYDHIEWIN